MKKRLMLLFSLAILFFMIFTSNAYAYTNATTIPAADSVYKEGIYKLDSADPSSYDLQFQFIDAKKNSTIIVLDENADIVYKNVNCNRKCNAGTISNKNTIILITDGETALYFNKVP